MIFGLMNGQKTVFRFISAFKSQISALSLELRLVSEQRGLIGMGYAPTWVISRLFINIGLKNLQQNINKTNFGATNI